MTGDKLSLQIEKQFINFYQERGHHHLPECPLVSQDKNLLYTIAGMIPFKSFFDGTDISPYQRVVTSQRCIRTNDINRVGETKRHLTGFTMLGHFSFGDYFKEESISMGYSLVTEIYKISPRNLIITVHPDDEQTQEIWSKYLPPERIILTDENTWSSGIPGISGRCTEFFYDFHPDKGLNYIDLDSDRFVEFYNIVFIDSKVDDDRNTTQLPVKCVDSGLGLERLTYILSKKENIYSTDSFDQTLENPVNKDHYRTCNWIINEGIKPSNSKHGYILRKLMRRMFQSGYNPKPGTIFETEFKKYQEMLRLGKSKLSKLVDPTKEDLLNLCQTFGIPIEISNQILKQEKQK